MHFAIIGSRGYPSTYGGFETFVRIFAPYLVEQGHEVTVYCRRRAGGGRRWEADGVTCRHTPGLDTNKLSTLSFGATAALDAARRRYDAALVLNIANGYFLPALRAAGVPVALNTDGLEWQRGKWNALGRRIFRGGAWASARWADELVVDSEAIGAIWAEMFDVSSTFIPYGAPVVRDDADDRVRALGLTPDGYVLVVARLIPENHVELTMDAVARLGPDVPLVVVGSASSDSPIEDRLRHDEHTRNTRWLGHVSDQVLLTQLWRNSAVYVHGHSVGGTNPALLQALGAGAPTLALDTAFNREVIRADRQMYTADRDRLAERIADVLSSPLLRVALRAYGQRVVASRYQWPDVCHAYTMLLERLAGVPQAVPQPVEAPMPAAASL